MKLLYYLTLILMLASLTLHILTNNWCAAIAWVIAIICFRDGYKERYEFPRPRSK